MSADTQENSALIRRFNRYQRGMRVLHLCIALASLLLYLAVAQKAPIVGALVLAPILLVLIGRNRRRAATARRMQDDPEAVNRYIAGSWKFGLVFCAYVGAGAVIFYKFGGPELIMPIIIWAGIIGFGGGVLAGPNTPYAPLHIAFAVAPISFCLAISGSSFDGILAAMVLLLSVFAVYTVREFAELLNSLRVSRRNEERMKQVAESRLCKFLEAASDWAWQTDAEHRFTYLSPNFERLTNLSRENVIGKTRREAFWGTHLAVAEAAIEEIEKRTRERAPIDGVEVKFKSPLGAVRWRTITGYPEFNADHEFVGYSGWAVDITDKIKARARLERYSHALERKVVLRTQKLEKHAEDLKTARDLAEQASQAKSEFIRNVSHEFRTPLHVILGYSEMLAIKAEDDLCELDPLAAANEINRAGRGLLRLINNVITFSTMDAATLKIDQDIIYVDDLIASAIEDQSGAAKEENIRITPSAPSGLRIYADYSKLSAAFSEILRNAVIFSPKDGTIEIRAADTHDEIVIEVLDKGEGPPEDIRAMAFDPFQIGSEDTRTKSKQGAGLGLAIASRYIHAHGGTIEIGLREGGGARVAIHLPRALLVGDAASNAAAVQTG